MWHRPQGSGFLSDETSDAFLADGGEVHKMGHPSFGLTLSGAFRCMSPDWVRAPGTSGQHPCSPRAYVLVGRANF